MSPSASSVASPRVVSIADLRTIAERRVPASVFDYLDGGAEGEVTLRENCRVYEDVTFRPRAAGNAGPAYFPSTISGHRLEDVKAASTGPVFYQLYLMDGRGAAEAAIDRARTAGFSALVVTIDTTVSGMRERDFRNGMKELVSGNPFQKIPYLPQILSRPGWLP